ncbi:endosomal/lysosomal proton channel TMEM175 [Bos taurus]|uniref:Endosomal/lysosomal proton channel TMEM175 n=1 Tax=Bos taurus TaxID=9913 RepID=TM175_BOVIN|nr:endosomal/lysosomal proton channel TMEM175 [Bos taurus]XP_005889672.1 PREDICTED: endosomal/lysomomal potassium channel TMEM175 isoform X2 [Bos mutus]Q32PG7.1 RecName: Full=Endosomal/lysosomal proton channel TMEM175; AltName: Full=Potassium channel TMEM175; AltName: Full=Transmembrane protein 175 [Bos taurus]AAI08123.1 Transmembrane protein 175 [Bos taurus]DAA28427.1 TPA: transmembrane protein 175 [Bos taurus]
MSGPQAPEPTLEGQADASAGSPDEDAAEGIQHSHRMLSFSDALLSIIATVMEFDKSVQRLLATRIAVYLMTFLIVTVAWAAHTRLFQVVGKIDDTLALLNLFSLMVTFPEVPLGIFLFCMCVIAIGAVQALIVLYAFHFPHLLSPQIERSAHRGLYRQRVLGIIVRGPALCLAAAGFSLFFYPASYLLMAMVIVLPHVSKAAGWCRAQLVGPREPPAHSVEVFTFDLHEPLSKERVEAFSDGVYAIVATLLILDICEDNVPDAKDVKEKFQGSLVAALGESGPHFLAYFGSFATVGLLWFAHHSLFLHIRRATQPMGLLNTLSLAFVGGLPLAYQQTSAFTKQPRDELESVRISCAIIFLASIFQFAIWTTALLQEGETLQPSARFGGREHAFMFAKLALYPCASLLAFACTCVLSSFSTAIFHAMQIAVPFAFLLLRLLVRLALAGLRALRGLVGPVLARPAPGAADEAQSPLLPAPC